MSPSSLTTSEKSDTPANAPKNELSGESDPGYESDGTKKRLRLQIATGSNNHDNTVSTLSITHKSDQYEEDNRSKSKSSPLHLNDGKEYSSQHVIKVGNDSSNVSPKAVQPPKDKHSFSGPIVIKHGSSIVHSSSTNDGEKFNNVKSQDKNSTYSNSRDGSSSCDTSILNGIFPKHSVLPQRFHVKDKNIVQKISIPNKILAGEKHFSSKGKSNSNVLVIPIESKMKQTLPRQNDEDIEVSSIFEDLIQSANEETKILVDNSQYDQYHGRQYVECNPQNTIINNASSTELPNVTMKLFSPMLLEDDTLGTSKALRSALSRVDVAKLGTSYDLVLGFVKKKDVSDGGATSDGTLKKFATIERNATTNCDILRTSQPEDSFYDAKKKCLGLKRTLSRIKNEIDDRKCFLEIIKEIASAIKKLLDSVNNVIADLVDEEQGIDVEEKKKDFVRGSKRFSNTLKDYFRHGNPDTVISASEALILHVNEIMIALIVVL